MKRWWVHLELLDDLVLSRRSATQGDHECRDRIPGSTLRGYCAAQLYDSLGTQAWNVFHSGRVRWLDGLPADAQGQRSLPVPLSWHADKADAASTPQRGGWWQPAHLFNLAAGTVPASSRPQGFQPKGQREGYVGSGGQALTSALRYRLMTAIGADGQVADGQLFGYESLAAGQHFVAGLELDDELLDAANMASFSDALTGVLTGVLRLGRSRSAQYGRVRARLEPAPTLPVPPSDEVGTRLHVLLIADACLRDPQGRPTLTPDAAALGLPPGVELDTRHSFLRSRRYSGWNAYRGGPEMERQVLAAGGVVTLHSPTGFDTALLQRLAAGIGTDRALGLGEVMLHPRWLRGLTPQFDSASTAAPVLVPTRMQAASAPDTALLRLLAQRAGTVQQTGQLDSFIAHALQRLAWTWSTVRRYRAEPAARGWGPGPSQWGALAQAGARAVTLTALHDALLGAQGGIVSRRLAEPSAPAKDFWDATTPGADGRPISLAHWVQETLHALQVLGDSDAVRLDAWQRLCNTVRRGQPHVNEAALDRLAPNKEAA